jgi:uncharacterized protein YjaG (DUF416 family)
MKKTIKQKKLEEKQLEMMSEMHYLARLLERRANKYNQFCEKNKIQTYMTNYSSWMAESTRESIREVLYKIKGGRYV